MDRPLNRSPDRIRRMFAHIAPRYDFLNHFLSANRDRAWRRRAVDLAHVQPGESVLDICTGTGDLAFEAQSRGVARQVIATDFCPEMVRLGVRKRQRRGSRTGRPSVEFAVADAMRLPFGPACFDLVTVGFGIRNVQSLVTVFEEMFRVLRPGGRAVILEFTRSARRGKVLGRLFDVYFDRVLPRVGRWLSSARDPELDDAYRYLPDSVAVFPVAEEIARMLGETGFQDVRFELLALGIAAIHVGHKPVEMLPHGGAPR